MSRFTSLALVCALSLAPSLAAPAQPHASSHVHSAKARKVSAADDDHKVIDPSRIHHPVLWHNPGDIAAKDLFYGAGGPEHQPRPPFKFLAEDLNGSNPKFDARDADDTKWRVKLGTEARPEVVASRLLWAVGFYTEIDYLLPEAHIARLKLHRGSRRDRRGELVLRARFARKPEDEKRIAAWSWRHNPFTGTREFNGLRVMMAVLNNWDLKDVNNAVYLDKQNGHQIFLVSDIGATFATNSLRLSTRNDKGNVHQYIHSRFITGITPTEVSFGTPAPPTTVLVETAGLTLPSYIRRSRLDWIGDHIPRADARWMGSLLGQLSHRQLVEAFRAGHFSAADTEAYVKAVEERIRQLQSL